MGEWITKGKPEKLISVLVTAEDRGGCRYVTSAWWDGSCWRDCRDFRVENVEAWMDWPEPYEGD